MNTPILRPLLPSLLVALFSTKAFASDIAPKPGVAKQVTAEEEREYPRAHNLYFDVPAFDLRENGLLGFWPSMRQSMAVTKDVYYLLHGAVLSIPYPEAFPGVANNRAGLRLGRGGR